MVTCACACIHFSNKKKEVVGDWCGEREARVLCLHPHSDLSDGHAPLLFHPLQHSAASCASVSCGLPARSYRFPIRVYCVYKDKERQQRKYNWTEIEYRRMASVLEICHLYHNGNSVGSRGGMKKCSPGACDTRWQISPAGGQIKLTWDFSSYEQIWNCPMIWTCDILLHICPFTLKRFASLLVFYPFAHRLLAFMCHTERKWWTNERLRDARALSFLAVLIVSTAESFFSLEVSVCFALKRCSLSRQELLSAERWTRPELC